MKVLKDLARLLPVFLLLSLSIVALAPNVHAQSPPATGPIPSVRSNILPLFPPPTGNIVFTPNSITLASGDISPAFGTATKTFTTQYKAFGVVFGSTTTPPGTLVPTAIFSDGDVDAWGGVNGGGTVDLLASVVGCIVVPGTTTPAVTNFLRVEAGYADVGNLLLRVYDGSGNLVGSAVNNAGIGTHGRTLLIISTPGIRCFVVSTPAPGGFADTFGVDEIQLNTPLPLSVTVNLNLVTYKIVNVLVQVLQGSTVVASQSVTLSYAAPTRQFQFFLIPNTSYTVRISGYSIATQTQGPVLEPATLNFYIH